MVTTKRYTADALWLVQQETDDRYELIEGALIRMSPTAGEHGEVETQFARHLGNYNAEHQLGAILTGDVGFILGRNPDTVLGPDVAFVSADRLPPRPRQQFLSVIPNLVVEIVSSSDSARDVADKVHRYLAAGVSLVWVASFQNARVVVHEPGAVPRELSAGDILDGGAVLPGFRVPVADLFAG